MFVNYYVTLIRACINYLFSGSTTYTVFLYLKTILLCIMITIVWNNPRTCPELEMRSFHVNVYKIKSISVIRKVLKIMISRLKTHYC